MDLGSHGNVDGKDVQSLWLRTFPIQAVNRMIVGTLSKCSSLPLYQKVTVARLVLEEIIKWQAYNKQCQEDGFMELLELEEEKEYMKIFEAILGDIIKANDQEDVAVSRDFLESVWKYKEEGTVNFVDSQVPSMLLRTVSQDRLEVVLLDALSAFTDVSANFEVPPELVQLCSPYVPSNFQVCMKILCNVFIQSSYHPIVLRFTKTFIQCLSEKCKSQFFNLLPTNLKVIVVLSWLLQNTHKASTTLSSKILTKEEVATFLSVLDSLYKSCDCGSAGLAESTLSSFYVAACSEGAVHLIQDALDRRLILYRKYPYLHNYLHRLKFQSNSGLFL